MAARDSHDVLNQLSVEFEKLKQRMSRAGVRAPAQHAVEQRTEKRFQIYARGTCMAAGWKAPQPITVYDISMRGVLFRTPQRLEIGSQIVVIVYVPGAQAYEEVMRVRWIGPASEEDPGEMRVGASLIERLPAT